jgi:alkyl sulfatase BDS1-like metallo-beta-lactamase superfamily hydrolase
VLATAQEAYDTAKSPEDYRWVAELLSHLVFAEPDFAPARELEADALEQLGYVAESGPWRNFYLAGARELRYGTTDGNRPENMPAPDIITPDVIAAMPLNMVFDYLGIRMNTVKVQDQSLSIGFIIVSGVPGDPGDCTALMRNSVLNYRPGLQHPLTALYSMSRATLNGFALALPGYTPRELEAAGKLTVQHGGIEPLETFNSWLDTFEFWFPLTLPSVWEPTVPSA